MTQKSTWQAMYESRKIKARSHNHCCSRKAITITYHEGVFVAFGIQHAVRMRHIFIFGMSGFTIFCHIISYKGTMLGEKKY